MKPTPSIAMLAVLGLGIIGAAHAAPPVTHAGHGDRQPGQSLGTLERKQKIAAIKQNQRLFKQPKTQKEALATVTKQPDGTLGVAIPENLWNNLSVQKHGSTVHVLESDGTAPAPANSEGAPNE
jgi:hypothetical protein